MAELVVVRFKVIDVEHHKAHRKAVTIRALDLFRKACLDVAAVQKPREGSGHRELVEFTGFLLEQSVVDGHRELRGDRLKKLERLYIEGRRAGPVCKAHDADRAAADVDRAAEKGRCLVMS